MASANFKDAQFVAEQDGFKCYIVPDDCAEDPRKSMDFLGTIVCTDRDSIFGISHDAMDEIKADPNLVWGQIGSFVAYCSKADGLKAMSDHNKPLRKLFTKAVREKVARCLHSELEMIQAWADGYVYGVVVDSPLGEEVDAAWGVYGEEYAEECAKEALGNCVNHARVEQEKIRARLAEQPSMG